MPAYLRVVWLLLGLASMITLVVLFLLPAGWEVEREIAIDAPPEAIWPRLVDLEEWRTWSPWQESAYEGLVYEYSEDTRGVGAEQRWSSAETGDGVLRIVAAEEPRRLEIAMEMQQGAIVARDVLRLTPLPSGATKVTWTDRGTLGRTLLGRLSLPVVEESMGRDLARGLENLKSLAEAGSVPDPGQASEAETEASAPAPHRDAT